MYTHKPTATGLVGSAVVTAGFSLLGAFVVLIARERGSRAETETRKG
ncbi:hypothetical protein ABZ863_10090 [Saccharomonospora sp. NPDC046836]